jgi:cytochrome c556
MKKYAALAVAAVMTLGIGATVAQAQDSAATIKQRQEHMKALGGAMSTIGKYIKKEGGTLDDVKKAAVVLNERSRTDLWALFPTGTAAGVGESAARPEIWQKEADFKTSAAAMRDASGQLLQAAEAGNDQQIAQAFGGVGRSCGSCHDAFRVKKN